MELTSSINPRIQTHFCSHGGICMRKAGKLWIFQFNFLTTYLEFTCNTMKPEKFPFAWPKTTSSCYDSTSQYDYELWNMILSNPFDPFLNLVDSCQNQNYYNQSNWKFSWDGVRIKGHIECHQVKWMESYLYRLCNCLLEKSDEFMPGFIGICGDAVPGLLEIHSWVIVELCMNVMLNSNTFIPNKNSFGVRIKYF